MCVFALKSLHSPLVLRLTGWILHRYTYLVLQTKTDFVVKNVLDGLRYVDVEYKRQDDFGHWLELFIFWQLSWSSSRQSILCIKRVG